jgi:phosphoribosylformylglycinamidine synthase subunit PurL
VSFYNQTGDTAVHPTPVIGVLGLLDDVSGAVGNAFVEADDTVLLIGAPTRPGLAGSEHQWLAEGRIAGRPPRIDLEEEARLQRLLVEAARRGLLRSAHDVSTGGLITAAVESCLRGGLGADLIPEEAVAPRQWLFSESPTRVVVSAVDARGVQALCADHRVPVHLLGMVVPAPRVRVGDWFDLDLSEARAAVEEGLPRALGEAV